MSRHVPRDTCILIVNAGSSSLKLSVLNSARDLMVAAHVDVTGQGADIDAALTNFIASAPPLWASGHRIVHGGPDFRESVLVDDQISVRLEALAGLAPLHNPPALCALRSLNRTRPNLPSVACFDTAFHSSLPAAAATYPLPMRWRDGSIDGGIGLRRYGFHGLAHQYSATRAAQLLGTSPKDLRLLSCHLGSGASLAAVAGGRSVDTTMGFTPLDGLVMATRGGTVDPGALLWLQQHGVAAEELGDELENRSGLMGLTGCADMREVEARAVRGDRTATLAIDVYVHRLVGLGAAMVAALGGVDVVTFSGGVGEGSATVRSRAIGGWTFLGLTLDAKRNEAVDGTAESIISEADSRLPVIVIRSREDVVIADEVDRALRQQRGS